MATSAQSREGLLRRGRRLEYFTVAYNSAEALASLAAGLYAGSVSLVSFGLDSVIEVASGAALLWRLGRDWDRPRRERAERTALRIVGWCFLALAAYVACEAAASLIRRETPQRTIAGIAVTAASVVVMPWLARAKRRVAAGIASGALRADSRQADFCAYLSAIVLGGLLLNALAGWWWADPAAALAMVPIIAREGVEGLRGKACDCREG